jgi:hypothetical protein
LATDQIGSDAGLNHALEYLSEDVIVAEPFVARPRECRVIRQSVLDAQTAKPSVGQIDLNLTPQGSFRTDSEDIADDQHPDHQDRINRRATNRGIMRRQLVIDPCQVENRRDLAYQMISWDRHIEIKRIEQLPLVPIVPTHHGRPRRSSPLSRRNHGSSQFTTAFCNNIGQE